MSMGPTEREKGYMEGWQAAQLPPLNDYDSCFDGTVLYDPKEDVFFKLMVEYDYQGDEEHRSWYGYFREHRVPLTDQQMGPVDQYIRIVR